jgi:hypothetical protein
MRHEMCAQSKDPAKCEANARERFEKRKNPKIDRSAFTAGARVP